MTKISYEKEFRLFLKAKKIATVLKILAVLSLLISTSLILLLYAAPKCNTAVPMNINKIKIKVCSTRE